MRTSQLQMKNKVILMIALKFGTLAKHPICVGIARAYRSGLTHELTVVRFLAQNTVEQDLYAQLQFFDRKE